MQNETDRLLAARTGATLADLMLARGAQLAGPAVRTAEQAVTAAEVIAEAEAITEDAVTCTHAACLNALHDECECACGGIGHGAATHVRQATARTRYAAKVERLHSGDIFATVPAAPADELTGHRFPGLAAIQFDADGWPID